MSSQKEELAYLVESFGRHVERASKRRIYGVSAKASPRIIKDDALLQKEVHDDESDPCTVSTTPDLKTTRLSLEDIRTELGECQRCRLHQTRKSLVFGQGAANADLMIIGEAPGHDEDLQGEPFVGKAGQLLTKMLKAMGLERDDVYITNILKCRPPQNRNPSSDEVQECEPFLKKQIDVIGPRIVLAMGNFAVKTLLQTTEGITRLRGNFKSYHGIPVMPTFHPAYLLRNETAKRPAWNDLQQVMKRMDELGLNRKR